MGRRNGEKLAPLVEEITADGGQAHGYTLDARDEESVQKVFAQVESDVGPLDLVIFNVGGNVRFSVLETTSRVFRKVWEMAAFAGFLSGREAARHMVPRGRGAIFFTGASASLRGNAGFAAFGAGKAALRSLAQSMARELGPHNIHVAHLVIDAGVDTGFVRARMAEAGQDADAAAARYAYGADLGGRSLLGALPPIARRLDIRDGPAPLWRKVLMQDIELYYDFGSPNAYFVHKVLPAIAHEHGP